MILPSTDLVWLHFLRAHGWQWYCMDIVVFVSVVIKERIDTGVWM